MHQSPPTSSRILFPVFFASTIVFFKSSSGFRAGSYFNIVHIFYLNLLLRLLCDEIKIITKIFFII